MMEALQSHTHTHDSHKQHVLWMSGIRTARARIHLELRTHAGGAPPHPPNHARAARARAKALRWGVAAPRVSEAVLPRLDVDRPSGGVDDGAIFTGLISGRRARALARARSRARAHARGPRSRMSVDEGCDGFPPPSLPHLPHLYYSHPPHNLTHHLAHLTPTSAPAFIQAPNHIPTPPHPHVPAPITTSPTSPPPRPPPHRHQTTTTSARRPTRPNGRHP